MMMTMRTKIIVMMMVREGGFWGGLFYPKGARFAPLEVFYYTRFGSKHNIMVQLANVY